MNEQEVRINELEMVLRALLNSVNARGNSILEFYYCPYCHAQAPLMDFIHHTTECPVAQAHKLLKPHGTEVIITGS